MGPSWHKPPPLSQDTTHPRPALSHAAWLKSTGWVSHPADVDGGLQEGGCRRNPRSHTWHRLHAASHLGSKVHTCADMHVHARLCQA